MFLHQQNPWMQVMDCQNTNSVNCIERCFGLETNIGKDRHRLACDLHPIHESEVNTTSFIKPIGVQLFLVISKYNEETPIKFCICHQLTHGWASDPPNNRRHQSLQMLAFQQIPSKRLCFEGVGVSAKKGIQKI